MTSSNNKLKCVNFRLGNPRGVTLVELMVVIAILGIVLGLVYSIFISQMQSSIWRDELAERKQNLSAGINVMLSDFVKADSVMNTVGICNTNVAVKVGSDTIKYYINAADDELVRELNGSPTVVAENITNLSFVCYNPNGADMTVPFGATDYEKVRRVQITLQGETARNKPGDTAKSKASVTASVELRSIPQYSGSGCGMLYFSISDTDVAFCDPPGEKPTIEVYLCNLIGNAVSGQVAIYPKGGLPIVVNGIGGTTVSYSADGTAIMNVPDPAGRDCTDPFTAGKAEITAPHPEDPKLNPGTGLELLAVWSPSTDCGKIATSKSFTVSAGSPFMFSGALDMSPGIVNACQSAVKSTITAHVADACGHPISGETVVFNVLDSGGAVVVGDAAWGDMGLTTDNGDGTYSAVYNAGSIKRTVTLQAKDTGIVNAVSTTITNTITLGAHSPASLLGSAPVGNMVTVENCLDNTATVEFDVRDACNNIIEEDQTSKLNASNSIVWTPAGGVAAGMEAIQFDGLNHKYSTTFRTSTTHCGPGESDQSIIIDHSDIPGSNDLDVALTLEKCTYPGVNINVDPLSLTNCGSDAVTVTAQVLVANAADHNCMPAPTDTSITLELKNVFPDSGFTDWGGMGTRNGRFLQDDGSTVGNATRTKTMTTSSPAVANVIAWDARPGDNLYVRATASIAPYGNAVYGPKEYNNPVAVVNGTASVRFFADATFSSETSSYDTPTLVPVGTGNIYLQVRDCDANLDPMVVNSVSAVLDSFDSTGFINALSVDLAESAANSGVFNGTIPMRRVVAANSLLVNRGGTVEAQYFDVDEPLDNASASVDLSGCRELRAVDSSGNDVAFVVADEAPFDAAYPEGGSSFRLLYNAPSAAGNGIANTVSINVCSAVDNNTVTLKEDGDTGIFRINGPAVGGSYGVDYMYAGASAVTDPTPGSNSNLGVRLTSPEYIRIVIPATSTPCDVSDANVVNAGCSTTIAARVPVTLTATDSGWYTDLGSHTPSNTNYIVGNLSSADYRDFFLFSLAGITNTITSASLSIQNPSSGYLSGDPSETWTVYDVSTAIANLTDGSGGVAAFNDLGSGTAYGSAVATSASTTVTVNLNASAVAALNAARGGQIAFGGALTTLDANKNNTEYLFGSTSSGNSRTLTLVLAP